MTATGDGSRGSRWGGHAWRGSEHGGCKKVTMVFLQAEGERDLRGKVATCPAREKAARGKTKRKVQREGASLEW